MSWTWFALATMALGCAVSATPMGSGGGTGGMTGTGGTTPTGGTIGSGGTTVSGGVTGTGDTNSSGGACPEVPMDATQAAVTYAEFATASEPGLATWASFSAEEKSVPGLREGMQAQLWNAKVIDKSGTVTRECSFLYRNCVVTLPYDECNPFGPIISGVFANGAFYYSWVYGSGISYSVLGKLAPAGDALVRTTSVYYTNASLGPPNLVVAMANGQLVVYRATVYWGQFNDWLNPELMGTLADFGDRLGILDSNGQELGARLP